MRRLKPEDFARAQARKDACEEAEGEEGHDGGIVLLDVAHEFRGLRRRKSDGTAAPIVECLVSRPAAFKIPHESRPGQLGYGGGGEVLLQTFEVALHARQIRLGKQVLFALVILDDKEFRDGFRKEFLRYELAIVCER